MSEKITKALDYHFQNHRLIFWYDDGGKEYDIYTNYSPQNEVIKFELDRNEFHLKYLLLKEHPDKKVLIYSSSAKPQDTENWLLDLNLSNFIFASDESSLYLQELDLSDKFLPLIQDHLSFFNNNTERRTPLKELIKPASETEESLRIKMMSVLCGSNKLEREKNKLFPEIALNIFLDTFLEKGSTLWEKIKNLLDLSRVDLYKEADKQIFGRLLEGWENYTKEYYELDGDYRRFLYASSESDSPSIFATLLDKLEREYTESYLQPLADVWQRALDADPGISNMSNRKMGDFFKQHIEPYLMKDRNVFVIISDGLRYEIGVELAGLLEQKNRFQVEISDILAPTPSYTQLGMASLLPHNKLELKDDGDKVLSDGMSTSGLENRQKIVQTWLDSNYPEKKLKQYRLANSPICPELLRMILSEE